MLMNFFISTYEYILQVMLNDGEFYANYEDMPAKHKRHFTESLFPLPEQEMKDLGVEMW